MVIITEDYVSFEIAKLLVKKSFDYSAEYESYYTLGGEIVYFKDNPQDINIAPRVTLQMAMKWLREIHTIDIVITPSMFHKKYNVCIYKDETLCCIDFDGATLSPSYEYACEAAIKYCLEKLI